MVALSQPPIPSQPPPLPPLHYEQLRDARLQENRKRMQELGLVDLSQSLATTARPNKKLATPRPRRSPPSPRPLSTPASVRRSSRLMKTPLRSYKEIDGKDEFLHKRVHGDVGLLYGKTPEYYTDEHEKLLGSCKENWELFKDGYDVNGSRVYDSARGKTCHQCRQKTLGLRTWCSKCVSLRGQFCGDCLFMRYGENILEVNQNKNWICPGCRDICNCSLCRIRKGWAPTGSMYRMVLGTEFKSVAHYLIMTRRAPLGESKDESKISHISSTELSEDEAKVISEDTRGNVSATDSARRALTFNTALLMPFLENDPVSCKETSIYEISDTECDLPEKADLLDGIASRLRKRS